MLYQSPIWSDCIVGSSEKLTSSCTILMTLNPLTMNHFLHLEFWAISFAFAHGSPIYAGHMIGVYRLIRGTGEDGASQSKAAQLCRLIQSDTPAYASIGTWRQRNASLIKII